MAVEKLIQQFGCLPSLVDGQKIPGYERVAFITALDAAITTAHEFGQPKLTIHLDLPDAARLLADMRTL